MAYSPLPESFLFGVATADHQCEAYEPRYEDVFDLWEREVGLTQRGKATDFWNRYREDIELAAQLGCKLFRLSISWARVEPEPGVWNDEAFDHYRKVLETIHEFGMEPVVTLHHFTWPVHVHNRGGMLDHQFPGWLGAYASECARRFGDLVRFWITINEPTLLPFGYIKFWWERHYRMPPGMGEASTDEQAEAVVHLMRNLFRANAAARSAIKEQHPEAMVSANPFVLGLPPWLQDWIDRRLTHMRGEEVFKKLGARKARRRRVPSGRADVTLSMLTCTHERSRQVLFSQPYYCACAALLVPKGVPDPPPDWGGTIAVVRGASACALPPQLFPKAHVRFVASMEEGLKAVEEGHAFLDHDTRLRVIANGSGKYRLVPVALSGQPYAAAVAQGDTELLDAVDGAIRSFIGSDRWRESCERHFPGQPVPEPPAVHRRVSLPRPGAPPPERDPADVTLEAIRRRGRLIAAVRDDAPGFSWRNPKTGELEGLEVDLARAIAKQILGDEKKVELHVVRAERRLTSVRSRWSRFLEPAHKLFSISSALFNTHWWHLGMAGRLPEFLCPKECVGQQDFVGLDYYWGIPSMLPQELLRLIDATEQRYHLAPVWPSGLYETLRRFSRMFPGVKILIIENGCVDSADGVSRECYLRDHIRQVQRAWQKGVPLIGYICWSITSNREWGLSFNHATDFGLYHIDLDHDPELKRVPTRAVEEYRDIIARRGA